MKDRSARIRDVAERARVSTGTVSNVINGLGSVKPANAKRVVEAMEELNFVANQNARRLRSRQSDAIGLIVHDITNPFFADIAHALDEIAEGIGCTVVLGSSSQKLERESRYLELFEGSRYRGLLISPVDEPTPALRKVSARGTPVVLLDDRPTSTSDFCSVALNGFAGGQMAAEHLLSLGRSRLAMVGGPAHLISDRVHGVKTAVEAHPGAELRMWATSELSTAEGRRVGRELAELGVDRPDGIFAANDLVALGLLDELLASSIDVPREIALVGYDNIAYSATAKVPITTVTQPIDQIASTAIALLLEEEEHGTTHKHRQVSLDPVLLIRGSSNHRAR